MANFAYSAKAAKLYGAKITNRKQDKNWIFFNLVFLKCL
jgi:hypothetical protein